jgi:hypothetical protein
MLWTLAQQNPGVVPGDCLSTLRPCSDACYADLPLTLLGAPVSNGETRRPSRSLGSPRPSHGGRPPGTEPHVAVRHNRGSDAIHSNRSPWKLGNRTPLIKYIYVFLCVCIYRLICVYAERTSGAPYLAVSNCQSMYTHRYTRPHPHARKRTIFQTHSLAGPRRLAPCWGYNLFGKLLGKLRRQVAVRGVVPGLGSRGRLVSQAAEQGPGPRSLSSVVTVCVLIVYF